MPLVIERITTAELPSATLAEVLRLCDAAYAAPIAPYLASIGAGAPALDMDLPLSVDWRPGETW